MKEHKVDLSDLPKETLIDIVEMYGGNLLTIDGLWFTEVEREFELDTAVDIDTEVWKKYASTEARRIREALEISEGGVQALVRALNFMTWVRAIGMEYEFQEVNGSKVVFNVTECRPQTARMKRDLEEFPCKPVGIAIFEKFAKIIDSEFNVRCLVCPPDSHPPDLWCSWEFTLEE